MRSGESRNRIFVKNFKNWKKFANIVTIFRYTMGRFRCRKTKILHLRTVLSIASRRRASENFEIMVFRQGQYRPIFATTISGRIIWFRLRRRCGGGGCCGGTCAARCHQRSTAGTGRQLEWGKNTVFFETNFFSQFSLLVFLGYVFDFNFMYQI